VGQWNPEKAICKVTLLRLAVFRLRLREHTNKAVQCIRKGIRYVLPVFCSPFAEPLISTNHKYWLRHISKIPPTSLPLALPRIVTPPELGRFLNQATEDELKGICSTNGWKL
jgi:hypothetical protein